jgi:L-asparaginase/Glu-tRNA(Gln) amidotransferase subunit D
MEQADHALSLLVETTVPVVVTGATDPTKLI